MNKKLRLLVTTQCPNKCPMCCNNSWDFSKLPVVDRWNYEQIMLTGGGTTDDGWASYTIDGFNKENRLCYGH